MKRVSSTLILIIVCSSIFTSCVKDYLDTQTNFENLQAHLEMRTANDLAGGYNNIAGLANFAKANLVFTGTDPDTLYFYVNLASVNALNKDVNVTIGVDQAAFTNYSSATGDPIVYEAFPDSVFSLPVTSLTIPAGQHVAQGYIIFYPDKTSGLDPAQSYMLPIGITDGDGISISANQGAVYYHSIGNPLAGNWLQSFYRWNDVSDTTGPPNSTVFEDVLVAVPPLSPTTVLFPEGYLDANGLGGVALSFTNTSGVITNPILSIDPDTQKQIDKNGFKVLAGPILLSYQIKGDANTHYSGTTFRFYFEILNNVGGDRKTINVFTKQ